MIAIALTQQSWLAAAQSSSQERRSILDHVVGRWRMACGIVRLSSFAVSLMTSSNLVGCSIGRSAGLS